MAEFKIFTGICMILCIPSSSFSQNITFTNPILDDISADPSILRLGDSYYMTLSSGQQTELAILKSPILTNFRTAERHVAYTTTSEFGYLWMSKMHLVKEQLYIYFTMRASSDTYHTMYVIQAENGSDPMGNWSEPTKLLPNINYGALDGTILEHDDQLYFVWACKLNFLEVLRLCISPMESATITQDPVVVLREPVEDWECQQGCVNQGPSFLKSGNVTFMIFSASSKWHPSTCLGQMSIEAGQDPMIPENWKLAPEPVFTRNDEEGVYATGHAGFTLSPDGTETWMIYHGTKSNMPQYDTHIARIEKIEWNSDGNPIFPRPHGVTHAQALPSGQTQI